MTPFERRVAVLEAAKSAVRPVPSVLFVGMNETRAEAFARFDAAYPHRKPGHAVLVVPAKPRTEAEHALWARRFKARQLALVSAARSERIAVVKAAQSVPGRSPKSAVIRPKGPHIVWKPNA